MQIILWQSLGLATLPASHCLKPRGEGPSNSSLTVFETQQMPQILFLVRNNSFQGCFQHEVHVLFTRESQTSRKHWALLTLAGIRDLLVWELLVHSRVESYCYQDLLHN